MNVLKSETERGRWHDTQQKLGVCPQNVKYAGTSQKKANEPFVLIIATRRVNFAGGCAHGAMLVLACLEIALKSWK